MQHHSQIKIFQRTDTSYLLTEPKFQAKIRSRSGVCDEGEGQL